MDIHINDTFFVFRLQFVLILFSILGIIIFLVHLLARKVLPEKILRFQLVFTVAAMLLSVLFLFFASKAYNPGYSSWNFFKINNDLLVFLLGISIICHLTFILFVLLKFLGKLIAS